MEAIVRRIATAGGSSHYDMGSHFDVACFYHAIQQIVETSDELRIVDRVYKRYLHESDYTRGTEVFTRLREALKTRRLNSLQWIDLNAGTTANTMKLFENQIATDEGQVVLKYRSFCTSVLKAIESAAWKAAHDRWADDKFWQTYVRTIRDAHFMADIRRPMADLDALGPNDPPLWLHDKNYPHNAMSREEMLAVGRLMDGNGCTDAFINWWAKNFLHTAELKRSAALNPENGIKPHQSQMLLDLADAQERKLLKASRKGAPN
jgi:hypothetical protein